MIKSLITTIIPTYRRPHYLKKAIQSVLSQTNQNFQIWVCDNASGDETAQIVAEFAKYDPRVRYFCHESNVGMLKNYEFGLSLVDTEFFSFLSDDDVFLPNFYDTALKEFKKHPDAGFVAGSTAIMTEQGSIVRIPLSYWPLEGKFNSPEGVYEMIGKYPVPTSVLFRKKATKQAKIDMENPQYWDCDYLLQIAAAFPIVISKKPCAIFRQYENSFSNQQNLERHEDAFKKLIKNIQKNKNLTSDQSKKAANFILFDLARSYKHFLLQSLMNKQFEEAFRIAKLIGLYPSFERKSKLYLVIAKFCKLLPFSLHGLRALKIFKHLLRRLKSNRQKLHYLQTKKLFWQKSGPLF